MPPSSPWLGSPKIPELCQTSCATTQALCREHGLSLVVYLPHKRPKPQQSYQVIETSAPTVATPNYHLSNTYRGIQNTLEGKPYVQLHDGVGRPPSPLDSPPNTPQSFSKEKCDT